MKKIICLLLLGFMVQIDTQAIEMVRVSTKKVAVEATFEKSVLRRRKRNRDGFFRRIFRKDKGCGCPKM